MLTAVVARAPRFGGTVKSFDATEAKKVKGVVDVVQIPVGIAVLANGFWAAKTGREALKIEWDDSKAEKRGSAQMIEEFKGLLDKPGADRAQGGRRREGACGRGEGDRGDLRIPLSRPRPDGTDGLRRAAQRGQVRDLVGLPVPQRRPCSRRGASAA